MRHCGSARPTRSLNRRLAQRRVRRQSRPSSRSSPHFRLASIPTSDPNLDIVNVTGPGYINEDSGGIRLDYNLRSRFRLYARYFRDQGGASQTQNSTLSQYATTAVPQNAVLSLNQVYSPTLAE